MAATIHLVPVVLLVTTLTSLVSGQEYPFLHGDLCNFNDPVLPLLQGPQFPRFCLDPKLVMNRRPVGCYSRSCFHSDHFEPGKGATSVFKVGYQVGHEKLEEDDFNSLERFTKPNFPKRFPDCMIRHRFEHVKGCEGSFRSDQCVCLQCSIPQTCVPVNTAKPVLERLWCYDDQGEITGTLVREYRAVLDCKCRKPPDTVLEAPNLV